MSKQERYSLPLKSVLLAVLLCVATAVISIDWVRSYYTARFYQYKAYEHPRSKWYSNSLQLCDTKGLLVFDRVTPIAQPDRWTDEELRANFTGSDSVGQAPASTWETLQSAARVPSSFSPDSTILRFLGFHAKMQTFTAFGVSWKSWVIVVPHWAILLIFGVPTFFMCRRVYAMSRASFYFKRNACLNCGYDLRASGDRCPECGALICNRDRIQRHVSSIRVA